MKFNNRIFSVLLLIIFFALVGKGFSQNSISGTVYYSDNNQIVTTGVVKAYDLNGIFVTQANINNNGTYTLASLSCTNYDVIGFPNANQETDNFPPTGFPDKINPAQMQAINAAGTIINKNIYVQRIVKPLRPGSGFISGKVTSSNNDLSDAVVYALIGENIFGYSQVDTKGNYIINGLSEGDYILVIHRIGDKSSAQNISLGSDGMENINFKLEPLKDINTKIEINPVAFTLNQNYPNPFNPSTLISYSVYKDSHVNLTVYNTAGEEVSSLINNDQKAGAYSVKFDGAGLSSGIYFYTLEISSGYKDTKRMVLIK